MRDLWNRVSIGWCRTFHSEPSWPAHGHYRCLACLRSYPVPWHEGDDFVRRENSKTDPSEKLAEFVVFEFQKDRG
jgi:hypothetical protein